MACSDTDDSNKVFDINSFPQRWELIGMSGGISGEFFTGIDMPWQETITLQNNKRFIKIRETKEERIEGGGVFAFSEIRLRASSGRFTQMQKGSDKSLPSNC